MPFLPDLSGFASIFSHMPRFWDALLLTILLAIVSIVGAIVWGLLIVALRMLRQPLISAPLIGYVELIRNTPLLLQIYLVYFGAPLLGLPLSAFLCGVIAIASQHGAFLSEIFRAGVESISKQQWESGAALGMTRRKTMRLVILPQALLKVMPPIGNQLVLVIKDTSLVSAIGILELTLTGKMVVERSGASFEVFVLIALLYLMLTTTFGGLVRIFETYQRARQ